jgi:hypothetical protein
MRTAADIAADLGPLVDELRASSKPKDWLDAYRDGDLLFTYEAADIASRSVETVRRWCAEAEDVGNPIALSLAGGSVWLISAPRFLDYIEATKGRPARLEAEERAKNIPAMRAGGQKLSKIDANARERLSA